MSVEATRRQFLRKVVTVAEVAVLAPILVACEGNASADPKTTWSRLSSLDRITKLEFLQHPEVSDFDPEKELIKAAAEFYATAIKGNKSAAELQSSVFFVDAQRLVEEAEKDNGRKFTPEEVKRVGGEYPEITTRSTRKVFINRDLINRTIADTAAVSSETIKQLQGRSYPVTFSKSMLFHAFGHVNQTVESFPINPIRVPIPPPAVSFTVNKFDGLDFIGTTDKGETIYVQGAKESMTEATATIVGQKTGTYLSLGYGYDFGLKLVEMIIQKAGIDQDTYVDIYMGRRSVRELFRKIGAIKNPQNPDERLGANALLIIGLSVDDPDVVNKDIAVANLQRILSK